MAMTYSERTKALNKICESNNGKPCRRCPIKRLKIDWRFGGRPTCWNAAETPEFEEFVSKHPEYLEG
jgi:hypothetical protein